METEIMVNCPGMYKNYDELEEYLTRDEVYALIEGLREKRQNEMRFMAALKGIDLDKNSRDEDFERVKRKAIAKAANTTEEKLELNSIGVTIQEIE